MEQLLKKVKRIIPTGLADMVRPAYHFGLAVIGETLYGFPGRKLTVIGVTGTNGKSTTCNLIASVLEAGGHKVGMVTTVNFKIGEKTWINESKMTSFGRFGTYRLLRQMVKAGCTHAVVEVSSHALHQHRAWGVPFQTAVLTNFTRDHLDYHGTMANYRAAKGRLFAELKKCRKGSTAVVNGDDPEAPYFLQFFADQKYVYGQSDGAADVLPLAHTTIAEAVTTSPDGSAFAVRMDGNRTVGITLDLPGAFNISNALAAFCVGLAHQVAPEKIKAGLESVPGVPGRMEKVEAGQPFTIIVDYAHTPDAFDNVLKTLKASTSGRLLVVFGATGDRDKGKRPDLGRVAATYADFLFLTEEDPGSEDPETIISEILPGIVEAGKSEHEYRVIPSRREAIREALTIAEAGDTVVLLAIGHQTIQVYRDGPKPWDDRQVAAEEWRKLSRQGV